MVDSSQSFQIDDRELSIQGYIVEAKQFVKAVESLGLERAIKIFSDFREYLHRSRKSFRAHTLVTKVAKSGEVVRVPGKNAVLQEVFSIAHIAACCHLFRDWNIPLRILQTGAFVDYVTKNIEHLLDTQAISIQDLLTRLRVADALRGIQILKLSGLASADGRLWRQLSPGAGVGNKELEGIHIAPKISLQKIAQHTRTNVGEYAMYFDIEVVRPQNVVLIEKAAAVDKLYSHLNLTQSHWILAMNEDYNDAIMALPALQMEKDFGFRNAVVAVMIDPLLVPDIPKFFDLLHPVLDPNATLIVTIGAGNDLGEFKGRVEFIGNLRKYLQSKDLDPVIFKMYEGDDWRQKWSSPSFGEPPVATFGMLYCKLKKNKLQIN